MDISFFSDVKNPVFSAENKSTIDLTCNIKGVGNNLLFTASADDCEAHGRQLYQKAVNGDYGDIGEYIAPVELESTQLLKSTRKTLQELSLEAFALQCAVDAGTASQEQIGTLAALKQNIAERIGENNEVNK